MIFPTVTEITPRPEAVTRDPFLAGDLADRTAREVSLADLAASRRGDRQSGGNSCAAAC